MDFKATRGGERSGCGGKTRSEAIRVWEGMRLRWIPAGGWVVSASCRLPRNAVGASAGDGRRGGGSVLVYLYNDVGWRWQYRKQK